MTHGTVNKDYSTNLGASGEILLLQVLKLPFGEKRFELFTSREAARSREGVVFPEEEEDVC